MVNPLEAIVVASSLYQNAHCGGNRLQDLTFHSTKRVKVNGCPELTLSNASYDDILSTSLKQNNVSVSHDFSRHFYLVKSFKGTILAVTYEK